MVELGIALRARRDPVAAAVLRDRLEDQLLPACGGRVLDVINPWES